MECDLSRSDRINTTGFGTGRRRRVVTRCLVALGLAGSSTQTSTANAALDPSTAVSAIKNGFALYSAARSLFGQSTAQQINQAVNQLIGYMNRQRDMQWRTAARSAAADLASLSTRQPGDPTADELFNNIWNNLSVSGIDSIYQELRYANDPATSYETAPLLNVMASGWTGLLLMKGQIFPGFPSAWVDYHQRLQPTMDMNYALAGSQQFLCWPWHNPGRGGYNQTNAPDGQFFNDARSIYRSELFRHLGNRWIEVGRTRAWTPAGYVVSTITYSNPTSGQGYMWVLPLGNIPITDTATLATNRERARSLYLPTFEADPNVKIIRAGMFALLSVGGGDEGYDEASTSLPAAGMFVDPWVYEGTSCGPYWGSAYPASSTSRGTPG